MNLQPIYSLCQLTGYHVELTLNINPKARLILSTMLLQPEALQKSTKTIKIIWCPADFASLLLQRNEEIS